ncbi:PepSY-associated TM helix domain-containing protein [Oleiphilus messinensis]|uniref:PepSY-associated TM helix domain-containing protein n=1 Tax=Oleiphilus messinensis TaxID=141451 RepID=A0A1Y0IDK6_9GAMM|nr:PepSY-associated TM helix domain-containing protein [Oleiphilus messinensis]ARU58249.1 PepSY-associated TM helix domain-containing protein [Oleiphilus messinensis]
MGKLNRRALFLLHGWFSLPIWILFSFICITGTIAVFSHEFTWLTNSNARADNPADLPAKPIPELIEIVQREIPESNISRVFILESYLVSAVSFSTPDKPNALAYINPYTGVIQEINQGITFITFMRSLHGWLLFPWHHSYSWGYYLVSAMSIVVLGALITGLLIYKRFWHAFTRPRIRWNKGTRIMLGDLHRLGGVWSIWFLLVMGVTGGWYLTQALLWHNEVEVWQHPDPAPLGDLPQSKGERPDFISPEQALEIARNNLPDVRTTLFSYPEHNRDYYSISGQGSNPFYDNYSSKIFINPWNGSIAQTRTPETMNTLQTLTHIADPLHYGTIAGLVTKTIWFFFGLVLSGMSISGFLIWSKRTLKPAKSKTAITDSRRPEVLPPATPDTTPLETFR